MKQGYRAGRCSPRRRPASACIRFRGRPPTSRSPIPIPTAAAWRRAPIAASANGSVAPTIRRPVAADLRAAGAGARADLRGAHRVRGDQGQSRRATARRRPASPMSTRNGEEWEQPADLVLVCAYSLFNVRLLLLSGIGKPYDPGKDEGVVGRNYAYQTGSGSTGVLRGRQVQSVRGGRLARRRARRLQQRQFRSRAARLCRRRLDHLRPHQRPADPLSSDAARHADLGQPWKKAVRTPISASPMSARRAA